MLAVGVALTTVAALAQTSTDTTAPASDQTVVLSPFDVSAGTIGKYQASEALAGGRVAESLFDSTDNVSIVTNQFIQDTAPRDIFNAVKYLAGVSNNSSQVAGDRVSIRGFQVSSPDIDGFDTSQSVVKLDPALYDTIEFVRGPDSLLAPNGSPGGTLNLVSKTPQWNNFGSVTIQAGEYDTDSGNFDLNAVASKTVAFRVVGSVIDNTQGDNQGYHKTVAIMPSVLFKLGQNSQLLLQATYTAGTAYNYLGLPINPATRSTSSSISLLPGLNPYETPYGDSYSDGSGANHADRMIYRALLTSVFNDHLSMRLSARYLWDWQTNNQWNLTGNAGGAYNPYTGQWTPGYTYTGSVATGYAAVPAPATTNLYTLSQSPTNTLNHQVDIQNDWVYKYKFNFVDTQTIGGFAAEASHQNITGYSAVPAGPVNVYALPQSASYTAAAAPSTNENVTGNFEQVYLSEKLTFLDGKVLVNGSIVPTYFYQNVTNYLSGVAYASHPNPTFINYGVDYVPIHSVSLYYGHSADAAQISPPTPPTATNPNPPQLQSGNQDEAGARFRTLDDKVTFSAGYFQLYQTNNSIVNPALFTVPPPAVSPPNLYANRVARGWEFETNMTLTQDLSLVGNYTTFTNRSPYGVRFRADPEHFGALYLNYRFDQGPLDRLTVGAGVVYQGKAAGDSASGVTAESTPTHLIPNQPSFYIPAYALVNFTSSYQVDKHWMVRFFLDNVLDKKYFAGSLNANAVMPGIPINPHGSITYSF